MAKQLYYPANLTNKELNPAWMQFDFFERKSPKESPPLDTIQLYMPESASQPSSVSWDQSRFGAIGGAVTGQMGGPISTIGGVMEAALKNGVANLFAAAASKMGGKVSAEDLMGEATGEIPNPYLTMVFKGVTMRSFAFEFNFFPFEEKDCETIDEIIRTFRAHSLPPGTSGSPFIKYPNEVEIKYMWKGAVNKWLHGFKRSVITKVDVDYTPNQMFSVMRNGFPSCINVKLEFSELEIVLRDDVVTGKNGIKY